MQQIDYFWLLNPWPPKHPKVVESWIWVCYGILIFYNIVSSGNSDSFIILIVIQIDMITHLK